MPHIWSEEKLVLCFRIRVSQIYCLQKSIEKIEMIIRGVISDRVTSAEIVLDLLSNVGGCGGLK